MNSLYGSDPNSIVGTDLSSQHAAQRRSQTVYPWDYLAKCLTGGLTGPPIEVNLVRHAETVANARRLMTGQSDAELTFRGYIQAAMLAFRLGSEYDQAWISSLKRSHQTLELVERFRFHRLSRLPVYTDPRLDERSLGDLEGTPRRPITAYALGDLSYAPERGESYLDLARRILSFLVDLRRSVQHQTRVLILTHAGPMRLLVGIINGLEEARSVLALDFANTQSCRCLLVKLSWPAFIKRGVLFERGGHLEITKGTPDDFKV
jgi:2,3-bisphosphoglycerate-dependent phosphoglycerate mutase